MPAGKFEMQKITVTLREATELSGIGRSSLYKLFKEGKLTPRKAGSRTLILVRELEDFVNDLPEGGYSNGN
jgi:predicted site-specific integrase-resolvase